jgi:hypothetical protein
MICRKFESGFNQRDESTVNGARRMTSGFGKLSLNTRSAGRVKVVVDRYVSQN